MCSKRLLAVALLSLSTPALAAPPAAQAQPATASSAPMKVGLGIAVYPIDGRGVLVPIEVYVPIYVSPMLRIEPSLGIATRNAGGNGTDTRDVVLGIGVLAMKRVAPSTDISFGGRLKLNFAHADFGPTDDSGNDVVIAGTAGGEQWFGDKFSLALEAQLGFYSLSNVSGDASGLFTSGVLLARVFF